MNYEQTLESLYARLPMFTRIGQAAYKADLHNTRALCEAIGNPQEQFKTIHIAGTNGKGSTSHMLAAILQQAGYKTGLYTSPHIKDFGERIRIDGKMIDEQFVIDFAELTKPMCDDIQPSFFELTVAMAFKYFESQHVDIAVIETGLGGRLDSTNVITPILSVITNIGLDHTQILGDTFAKIAAEKAGIIKPGIPVVIGEFIPETKAVFEQKAAVEGAEIYFATELYDADFPISSMNELVCKITDRESGIQGTFQLDLPGFYQVKNLCTVLASVKLLRQMNFTVSDADEKFALSHVRSLTGLKGRWDIIATEPLLICDVAHNTQGISQILNQLNILYPLASKIFVLGFVKDKDVRSVLGLFPKDAQYFFTNAHIPRAMPATELNELASIAGLSGEICEDVNEAVSKARSVAGRDSVIMICGSFFILGELHEK